MTIATTKVQTRSLARARSGASGSESMQRRLTVGQANDRYEREADRIADHVVGSTSLPAATPPPLISPLTLQRSPRDEPLRGPEGPAQRSGPDLNQQTPRPIAPATAPLQHPSSGKPALTPPTRSSRRPTAARPAAAVRQTAPAWPQTPAQPPTSVRPPSLVGPPKTIGQVTTTDQPKQDQPLQRSPSAWGLDAVPQDHESLRSHGTQPVQRMRNTGPEAPRPRDEELRGALTAQRDPNGPGAVCGIAAAGVERAIERLRSGPAPSLDRVTQAAMEGRMGVDLGGIRVHSGDGAARAAASLHARAFTVGQDIFFGRGQYDPASTSGRRLIAHEAAHTVQQRGGSTSVQRIQRSGASSAPTLVDRLEDPAPDPQWAIEPSTGGQPNRMRLPALELPIVANGLKGTSVAGGPQPAAAEGRQIPVAGQEFTLAPTTKRETTTGASVLWTRGVITAYKPTVQQALTGYLATKADVKPLIRNGHNVYALYAGGKQASTARVVLVGTIEELASHDGLLRPMLARTGGEARLDADHILELQIGGADSFENMWLLDADFNRSVGSQLKANLNKSIDNTLAKARELLKKENLKLNQELPTSAEAIKRNWTLQFKTVKQDDYGKTTSNYWTRSEIEASSQLKHFRAMTETEMIEAGLVLKDGVTPKSITIFPGKSGGRPIRFEVGPDGKTLKKPGFFYKGLEITGDSVFFPPTTASMGGTLARLPVSYTRKSKTSPLNSEEASREIEVLHDPALGFGGYVSRASVQAAFAESVFTFTKLSPIVFPDIAITSDGILAAEGTILCSKALLPGLKIPITLSGDQIALDFPLDSENLKFGPMSVTETTLRLGVENDNFFVTGSATVSVQDIGQGVLEAKTSKEDTLIKGAFIFDLNFVEKADLTAEYSLRKDAFSIKGTLRPKQGALPGVESGEINVDVTRETFALTGTLTLGGPLKGSNLSVGYTPESGLLIEAKDLPLPVDKLPGVSDAKLSVRLQRNPEGAWLVTGAGSAMLKAPGASGSLNLTLKGEALRMIGRVDVAKGPAKGYLQIIATNMAMDDQGNPIEGPPLGPLQIWGIGSASIAFGKVLSGTAAIEYTREGKIIISGEIALPPVVDLFDKVEYNKQLLAVTPPDFPIWGVKLGPVGVGIFAFVDARVHFLAYVGPGQLRDTKVSATMDLDRPAEAKVEGNAKLSVPAYAGFRLDLGGGLKAQLTAAYVKGRVGLDGTLGLAAETSLDVGVKWNASEGFAVSALAAVKASPKFELGVNASVTAGVDLGLTTIEQSWGPWRKVLGEFGPDMELSAKFPISYTDQNGLDLDISKIQVVTPRLDAAALMKDAFDTLV